MLFPILSIVFLILLHELAHYAVGRCYGMSVKVFKIGIGPSWTIKRDKRGTDWKIGLLPLAGYVSFLSEKEIQPMRDSEFVGPPTEEMIRLFKIQGQPFEAISLPKRIQVLLAGPVANLLAVYPLVFGFLMLTTVTIEQNEIIVKDYVDKMVQKMNQTERWNLPELKTGDKISEINGSPVLTPQGIKVQIEMSRLIGSNEIEIIVDKRYATEHEYVLDLDSADLYFDLLDYKASDSFSNAYRILLHDIIRGSIQGLMSLPSAILYQASDHPVSLESQSTEASGSSGEDSESINNVGSKTERLSKMVDSPIMMVKHQSDVLDRMGSASQKLSLLFLGAALISLGIGLFNLLPIIPLDGGQVISNILTAAKEEGLLYPFLHKIIIILYSVLSIFCLLFLIVLSLGGDIFELLT